VGWLNAIGLQCKAAIYETAERRGFHGSGKFELMDRLMDQLLDPAMDQRMGDRIGWLEA